MTNLHPKNKNAELKPKKVNISKKPTTFYSQQTFAPTSTKEQQNMTTLFQKEYISSYIVNEKDLANNELFNVNNILTNISNYIRMPLYSKTFLGLLHRIIIKGQILPAFKPEDISR
jgi:hypothetical protein